MDYATNNWFSSVFGVAFLHFQITDEIRKTRKNKKLKREKEGYRGTGSGKEKSQSYTAETPTEV